MSRAALDKELNQICEQVMAMSRLVGAAATESVDALIAGDADEARRVYLGDHEVNRQWVAVEGACLSTIVMQQPAGHDARTLTGLLEIATELERMGDYAKDIARNTVRLRDNPPLQMPEEIPLMADLVVGTLRRAMQALVEVNMEAAVSIANEDGQVDDLCGQLHNRLMDHFAAKRPEREQLQGLLTTAHNLERFSDRITNICERIVYMATGEIMELDRAARDERQLGNA